MIKKIVFFLGSARFAIISLALLVLAMILGTILESQFSPEIARMLVYHSIWFYFLEFAIVISLIVSVVLRLPFQKRLVGFYLTHFGIVTIFIGAFLTQKYGLDGVMILNPNAIGSEAINQVEVFGYEVAVYKNDQIIEKIEIPEALDVQSLNINLSSADYQLNNFIPWAVPQLHWQDSSLGEFYSKWILNIPKAKQVEDFEIVNFKSPLFDQMIDFGPLKIVSLNLAQYEQLKLNKSNIELYFKGQKIKLKQHLKNKYIFENIQNQKSIVEKKFNEKGKISYFELNNQWIFIPKFSSFPIDKSFTVLESSDFQLKQIEDDIIRNDKTVYLFDDGFDTKVLYLLNNNLIEINYQELLTLPWMGIELNRVVFKRNKVPYWNFESNEWPRNNSTKLRSAVSLKYISNNSATAPIWLSEAVPYDLGQEKRVVLRKKTLDLDLNLQLMEFRMEYNPGTKEPASYESLVRNRTTGEEAIISMNKPLKLGTKTIYQNSYFENQWGTYSSVLTVNDDPGRWLKYLGSLILIIGVLIQYQFWKNKKSEST